jgi:hypothetical protein
VGIESREYLDLLALNRVPYLELLVEKILTILHIDVDLLLLFLSVENTNAICDICLLNLIVGVEQFILTAKIENDLIILIINVPAHTHILKYLKLIV